MATDKNKQNKKIYVQPAKPHPGRAPFEKSQQEWKEKKIKMRNYNKPTVHTEKRYSIRRKEKQHTRETLVNGRTKGRKT